MQYKLYNNIKNKRISIGIDMPVAFFSLFSAWLLAVPFLGQVLNTRMIDLNVTMSPFQVMLTIIAQFIGLIFGGIIIRSSYHAKKIIIVLLCFSILGTWVFYFPYSVLWNITLMLLPFGGGIVVASWGTFFKEYKTSNEKLKIAGSIIIYSNLGMILLNVIAVSISSIFALTTSLVILFLSLLCCCKCEIAKDDSDYKNSKGQVDSFWEKRMPLHGSFRKSIILLYIFITIITIDSGIMYQLVKPAFSHMEALTSIYWALPYIGTIYIIKRLPERINKSYILYLAVTMIGLAYILFFTLDRSAASYIAIDTIMLGAFGICDLFWWAILGDMLAFTNKPAKVFGAGLSANILGIIIGSALCTIFSSFNFGPLNYTTIAIGIVFISLIVLPILYNNLSGLIKGQAFLVGLSAVSQRESAEESQSAEKEYMDLMGLTGRETEIARLLMAGRTYKMISQELFISENTVKTHIKNIYAKFDVTSKTEFMMKITHNK